ncbi:MAG: N-acetylmuramic acid 6-phosphate etherase [Elusimicrobia bacterium]|nr:N-acetylmuramic acid 6-phosphate etherase [Elusimicrobiota bacterium]
MPGARFYAGLPTERPNPRSRGLDLRNTLEIVRIISREDARVPAAVFREAGAIAKAADAVAAALARGGGLVLVGAGTSGRIAVMEAAECPPTFNTGPGQVRAVMAGGRMSVFRSKEGAEDDAAAGRKAAAAFKKEDVVIGVAASGITTFVRAALRAARNKGCTTVLVTSNGRPPGRPAGIVIAPDVGPEVVAGSTRLKSGTAAKLVLNAVTTAAMVRLGKVYDRWMVDLKPTSRKLRMRGVRIVSDLGGVSSRRAEALFAEAGGSVKTAIVMARQGCGLACARARLAAAGGALRRALGERHPS